MTTRTNRDRKYAGSTKGKSRLERYRVANKDKYRRYLRKYNRDRQMQKLREEIKALISKTAKSGRDKNLEKTLMLELECDKLRLRLRMYVIDERIDALHADLR